MWNYENVFKKLKYNEQGRYSITRPYEANQITNIIKNILYEKFKKTSDECVITDCTAGVGGDTISFSFVFKQVNSIELLENQFELLCSNVEKIRSLCVSQAERIHLYNCDYMDIVASNTPSVFQDILYIDPPWGGIGYKFVHNLKIYIGNKELKEVIKELINVNVALLIFIKLPLNADLEGIDIENIFTINNKKNKPSFSIIQLSAQHLFKKRILL